MEFRAQLEAVLCDRHSPEATALFETLLAYDHKRVRNIACRHVGQLSEGDIEELCGEVLLQLMSGGLARFRGSSLPELLAFCRTMCDRICWRHLDRRRKEQAMLRDAAGTHMDRFTALPSRPDEHLEIIVDSPLSETDQQYLRDLLAAGSKAELARRAGVSRAAVTQRIQRIRARIDALSAQDLGAHEVWMRQAARTALGVS